MDNSWGWLPWNWLDGIGKSVQYGLYCITNFIWTISLYLRDVYKRQELVKDLVLVSLGMGIGVVLMCIAQVSKMADEQMEEIKKERIDVYKRQPLRLITAEILIPWK